MEALQSIFVDEFKLIDEKPYKFEIMINSNQEAEERNFLKLKAIIDLPVTYPTQAPIVRLKNLCSDILDNNHILKFDNVVREKSDENLGGPMIFEICDTLREIICEMNEKILDHRRAQDKKESLDEGLKTLKVS